MHQQVTIGTRTDVRRILVVAMLATLAAAPTWAAEFTRHFFVEDCTWSAWGRQNALFSLRPGRQLVLEGEEDGALIRNEITMLRELEPVTFHHNGGPPITVWTRVMEERESEDGELTEVSRNWVARCVETSDIYYFGEEVDIYEDGEIVDHHGEWRAGVDGAQPGILMPGTFLLGAKYYQEVAPDVAEDRAEHTADGLTLTVPAGTFAHCVEVSETNPLSDEPSSPDLKRYCRGIGLVLDEVIELIEINIVP